MTQRSRATTGRSARATAVGAVAILLWSSLALLTTATPGVPPFELLTLSFAVAFAASLGALAARGREALARLRQPLAPWMLTFAGLFGYHALYFAALKTAPPAEASLVNYLWPMLIVVFSALLPGGRLRLRHVAGAALGLAGTALLLSRGGGVPGDGGPVLGLAAALGAALTWSGYSVLNRRFAEVPSEMIGGVCGAVALAGLACHLALEPSVMPGAGGWAAVVLLGLGPTGLAFFAWDFATKHGNLPVLGALSYLAPLLSTALLVAAGQAEASAALAAAAALTVAGAVVATSLPVRSPARSR
jgi:drug/metabolite transporter (DMT)-like permease